MTVKLNSQALKHATKLIEQGKFVVDERDNWSEHQPSTQEENAYLQKHGFGEYGKWYLGIDTSEEETNKGRYKFPYGDFEKVHRCGVISAESRAGQYKYADIERAAAHLHGMIDAAKMKEQASHR
jgi:hypothetical protein